MEVTAIEILSDNLYETEHFYAEKLGLTIKGKSHDAVSFYAGKSTLTFVKSSGLSPKYHFAFNIPHNKLDESLAWISGRAEVIKNGEEQVIADFKSWNAKAFYFFDNNGNILEFIARFDLDNAAEQVFKAASIACISEIGLVTHNPLQLAKQFIEKYAVTFFTKGAQSEKFVTLGNDTGLFIIVSRGRAWYPTQEPSREFYTKISFSVESVVKELTMHRECLR